MDPIPVPAPYGGLNDSIPKIALRSPECESLFNFNSTKEGISLRKGDSLYNGTRYSPGTSVNINLATFCKYNDRLAFVPYYDSGTNQNHILEIDSYTISYSTAAIGFANFYPQNFNNYLFLFSPDVAITPGIKFDGAAWTTIGYTGTGFLPIGGGNVFRSRNYIIQSNSNSYWYSRINAIDGALTKVDLAGIIESSSGTELSAISALTLSDQVTTTFIQCFIFSNGEILFYTGTYPDSDDWKLVGRARIGNLLSPRSSTFSYQGDTIILSDSGIISLRDLFLKGSEQAVSLSINSKVQKEWTTIIKAIRYYSHSPSGYIEGNVKGVWDCRRRRRP